MPDTADPSNDPRKYIRLVADLRAMIADGSLQPGNPAPAINELVAKTGYARLTCAKALRILEKEGILRRYPGLGYYVTRPD